MTTPTTATEAAQRERLIQKVHDALGGDGWAYSNYGYNELVEMRDRLEKVVDIFTPLVARAEAADRLAEAMNKFRNSPNERGHTVADFWRLADNVTDALVAYNAYRALAAEGQVQG